MCEALNGKGYVRNGEGVFVAESGEVYAYRDGELTPSAVAGDPEAYAVLARGVFAAA